MIRYQRVSLSRGTARAITPPSAQVTCQQPFKPNPAVREGGFSIIEILVVLTVLINLMSLGSRYIQSNLDSSLNQAMASHFKRIDKAANSYVKDHYADFLDQPSELELASLVNAGYLPPDFFKTNHYQQSYKIRIFPNQAGDRASLLQVLITTQDGQEISEAALRQISNLVGGQAGYVSILSPDKITGTQGGWEMNNSDLSITTGHLASVTWMNQQDIIDADGFLRRKKFEGHPEYNRMETDLQMQDHSIGYDNGEFKGKLSSNQLSFNYDQQLIELSLLEGPKIRLKNGPRTVELNSNQLSLGGFQMGPGGWMMPSKVDVNWNQVPFYELVENKNTEQVWKFVDERCEKRHVLDFPQGRLFLVGRLQNRENAGLFICSTPSTENDGYGKEDSYSYFQQPLKARAYLIAKVGREYDKRTFNVSDDPEDLISFSFPNKIDDGFRLWYLALVGYVFQDEEDLDKDPLIKEFKEQVVPLLVKEHETFVSLYNSGQLPKVANIVSKRIENLDFPGLKNNNKEIIEMIDSYNEHFVAKTNHNRITKHFKKLTSDKPW